MQQYQDEKVKPSKSAIIRWFRLDQFAPETAVTSHWVSPKAFFAIRLILALYSTITWWVYIGNTRSGKIFAFFTTLTFIGIHAYNIVSDCCHVLSSFNERIKILIQFKCNRLSVYITSAISVIRT